MKKYILNVGLLLVLGVLNSVAQEKKTLPNILIILADDLGYGDLGCQGALDVKTPNIDRLASGGITFTQFYANSTVCSPSRAALLTGKYPDRVGVPGVIRQNEENSWGHLQEDATLIVTPLKAKGYQTGMVGKWHLGFEEPNTPNGKGFDYFKGFLGDMMDDYYTHLRGGKNWMRENKKVIEPVGHATDIFTDWSLDYLKQRSQDNKPFLLYLAYNAPHFPIQPPTEYLDKVVAREPTLSIDRAKNVALIEHLDFNIGRIMNFLKESGMDKNLLIVFTSDNGGALDYSQSNGLLRGGKQEMYEGGIRVPAFVSWKNNIKAGQRTEKFAMLMDIFPTLCEAVGTQAPDDIDGISILPTLISKEQDTDNRYVFWMRREGGKYNGLAYYAARHRNYKLVQNTPFEKFQYFDVERDVFEKESLPDTLAELKKIRQNLQEHIRQSGNITWQKSKR